MVATITSYTGTVKEFIKLLSNLNPYKPVEVDGLMDIVTTASAHVFEVDNRKYILPPQYTGTIYVHA